MVDGHKHDCNPGNFEIIAISMGIGKYPARDRSEKVSRKSVVVGGEG